MRGVYTASMNIGAVSAAKTLMYLTAPSAAVAEILSASVTDESNDTNEQIEVALQRITTLGTPTATTITPAKHEKGDAASSLTVKGNVTANEPTYTADTEVGREGASMIGGWYFDPTPEERPVISPGESVGLRLLVPPSAASDLVVRVTFREIGG